MTKKLFISYTHDSIEHKELALNLANKLKHEGFQCEIDQYHIFPTMGWPTWMERGVREADFVFVVCSQVYKRRFEGEEVEGVGLGAKFESFITVNHIYQNDSENEKFIPIVLKEADLKFIPNLLKPFTHFNVAQSDRFDALCNYIKPELSAQEQSIPENVELLKSTSDHPVIKRITLEAKWHHETTEDSKYVSREVEIKAIETSYQNQSTRLFSLIGVGGTGKTALLGHWLKTHHECIKNRELYGLFYWSFYAQNNVHQFLEQLLIYLEKISRLDIKRKKKSTFDLLQQNWTQFKPTIIALDGLEVMQETLSEGKDYGAFIDIRIRDLLLMIASSKMPWFCMLTSRFPVSDLYRLTTSKSRKIEGLNDREGSQLLFNKGVNACNKELSYISNFFYGHPLALLIFASSLPAEHALTPKAHLQNMFSNEQVDNLETKLVRLLAFYKKNLETNQKISLACLSIFRTPVPQKTIESLFEGLKEKLTGETIEDNDALPETIHFALTKLINAGLLIVDKIENVQVYSCHPVIRDYFRGEITESDVEAAEFTANILVNKPDTLGMVGVSNIENLILSIELLLHSKSWRDFNFAEEVFNTRLDRGRIILTQGLAVEGKRCFEAFLKYFQEQNITNLKYRLPFEIRWFEVSYHLGEFKNVIDRYDIVKNLGDGPTRSALNRVYAKTCLRLGHFYECIEACNSSISIDSKMLSLGDGSADAIFIALGIKVQCYLFMGQNIRARQTTDQFKKFEDGIDKSFSDSILIKNLSLLQVALFSNQRDEIKKALNVCISTKPNLQNHFLKLDRDLLFAHVYLCIGNHEKSHTIATNIRAETLQKNMPYEYLFACYLLESIKLNRKENAQNNGLEQLHIQAKEMGFVYLDLLFHSLITKYLQDGSVSIIEEGFIESPNIAGIKQPLFLG